MTLTYRRLSEFVNAASTWLNANPSGHEKFSYALKKLVKQGREKFRSYEEQIEDIQITHSAVDEHGVIRRDAAGNLQYTPDGLKARNAELRGLQESQISFQTHYVKADQVPADLGDDYLEAFAGIVVPAKTDDDGFEIRMVAQPVDADRVYDIVTDRVMDRKDVPVEAAG